MAHKVSASAEVLDSGPEALVEHPGPGAHAEDPDSGISHTRDPRAVIVAPRHPSLTAAPSGGTVSVRPGYAGTRSLSLRALIRAYTAGSALSWPAVSTWSL